MARPRSTQAETRALTAAVEVLTERGVNGFTVDEVSRRSGVAKTTIYRHWANGAELLLRALDEFITPFPTPNTGSLEEDLTEFIQSIAPFMGQDGTRRLLIGVLDAAASDPEFERVQDELATERRQPLRTIVQLAQARGEISSEIDLELAVDLIEGPFFLHMVVRRTALPPESLERLVDLVVHGLTRSPGTSNDP